MRYFQFRKIIIKYVIYLIFGLFLSATTIYENYGIFSGIIHLINR